MANDDPKLIRLKAEIGLGAARVLANVQIAAMQPRALAGMHKLLAANEAFERQLEAERRATEKGRTVAGPARKARAEPS